MTYRVGLWVSDTLVPAQVVTSDVTLHSAHQTALRTMASLRWVQRTYGHHSGTIALTSDP